MALYHHNVIKLSVDYLYSFCLEFPLVSFKDTCYTPSTFFLFFTLLSHSELYFGKGNGRLGGEYTKVVYRAYTDHTFTKKISTDAHLGILGRHPLLNFTLCIWYITVSQL